MGRYILKTLGCKANLYDTQLIEQGLQKRGWTPSSAPSSVAGPGEQDEPVLCIVNSCTVTNEADKQSRKMATRLARENPNSIVVMTGCGAEVDPDSMAQVKGVNYVVGNQDKPRLVDLILEKVGQFIPPNETTTSDILKPKALGQVKTYEELTSKHPMDREWPAPTSFSPPTLQSKGHSSKTRVFLKIQEGCDSFCTYCIIPYGRGPSRSLGLGPLIQQVKDLVEQGTREVILTGTNIGDYGKDWNGAPQLDLFIEKILSETKLERLRVSSLDPTEITPKMISLMKHNPRFCPHFHVSLQSPHSRILRLMKRKYRYEHVKECLEQIKEIPTSCIGGAYVGMDVITGFPGETQEEFEWGYQALSELPWTRLHVFPYSERAGTPATRLSGSVAPSIRFERARKLNELSFERLKKHYQSVLDQCNDSAGSLLDPVLIENQGERSWISGFTPNYLRILLPGQTQLSKNDLVNVKPLELTLDRQGWDVGLVAKLEPIEPN